MARGPAPTITCLSALGSGAYRTCAALTEGAPQQVEIVRARHVISIEVSARIVPWVSNSSAEAVFHYVEVQRARAVVVVRVSFPEQAHLLLRRAARRQGNAS